jgi:hypothetical protein
MAAENIPTSTIQYANHALAILIVKVTIKLISISTPELIPPTILIHQSKNIG